MKHASRFEIQVSQARANRNREARSFSGSAAHRSYAFSGSAARCCLGSAARRSYAFLGSYALLGSAVRRCYAGLNVLGLRGPSFLGVVVLGFFLVPCGWLGILASRGHAAIIGIDNVHGVEGGIISDGRYTQFIAGIRELCHVPLSVNSFAESDLDDVLSVVDVLVVRQPFVQNGHLFSDEEIAAVRRFVAFGGGLLVLGEGGLGSNAGRINLNRFVESFGVRFSSTSADPDGRVLLFDEEDRQRHPILTQGLEAVGVDFHRPLVQISAPSVDLSPDGEPRIFAVADGRNGAGSVVFLSDSTLFRDSHPDLMTSIEDVDNRRLLSNILTTLARTGIAGAVNEGLGAVTDVLFLNDSPGIGRDREVEYNPNLPFTIKVLAPPGSEPGARVPFAVYLWSLRPGEIASQPFRQRGVAGCSLLPTPFVSGSPQPDRFYVSAPPRVYPQVGAPTNGPSPRAPSVTFEVATGLGDFFLQGVIFDPGAQLGFTASVTNGIHGRARVP